MKKSATKHTYPINDTINMATGIINHCHITYKQLNDAYHFNSDMVKKGYLRPRHKNGSNRSIKTESTNDLMGKIAEFAVYNMFLDLNINCTRPSLKEYPRGEADHGYDLIINGCTTIDVKSSKLFAKALLLPREKFQINSSTKNVELSDNDVKKNQEIPDLFISANVGVDHMSDYDNNFNKKMNDICQSHSNNPDIVPESDLKIFISGILLGITLVNCVKNKLSLFYGKNVNSPKPNNTPEFIPTCCKSDYPLDVDNYVFPFWYVDKLNEHNTERSIVRMLPPRRCL